MNAEGPHATVAFISWHHLPMEGIKFGATRGYCLVRYHGLLRGFPVALSQWILPGTYIIAVIHHSLLPPSSLPWWLHYSFRVSWSPRNRVRRYNAPLQLRALMLHKWRAVSCKRES